MDRKGHENDTSANTSVNISIGETLSASSELVGLRYFHIYRLLLATWFAQNNLNMAVFSMGIR